MEAIDFAALHLLILLSPHTWIPKSEARMFLKIDKVAFSAIIQRAQKYKIIETNGSGGMRINQELKDKNVSLFLCNIRTTTSNHTNSSEKYEKLKRLKGSPKVYKKIKTPKSYNRLFEKGWNPRTGKNQADELMDELRKLRKLQDEPGYNDFDRGAMK